MLSKLFFDAPAVVTPAVHLAVECLGGLDLTWPSANPVRNQVAYPLKAPRELTLLDVLDANRKVAAHFGLVAVEPAVPDDLAQVAAATERTAHAIAALHGSEWIEFGNIEAFDPKFDADPDALLYGLLHWSFDGNNLSGAAY